MPDFKKCPVCGSENTIVQDEINRGIVDGSATPGTKQALFVQQFIVADPKKIPKILNVTIKRPLVIALMDVCSDCGMVRCVHWEIGKADLRIVPNENLPGTVPPSVN